jgi:acyl-coenzyme A synthetase/AMP-(fatty) acid ligase
MAVVDENGEEFPPFEEGYVALKVKPERPPGLMLEYWKNPQAMGKAFRGNWYFTGDKAYRDEEGYFWFIGRDKEIIKTAGQSVAPLEIERVLLEHPAVVDAAVIGIPVETDRDHQGICSTEIDLFPIRKTFPGNPGLFR